MWKKHTEPVIPWTTTKALSEQVEYLGYAYKIDLSFCWYFGLKQTLRSKLTSMTLKREKTAQQCNLKKTNKTKLRYDVRLGHPVLWIKKWTIARSYSTARLHNTIPIAGFMNVLIWLHPISIPIACWLCYFFFLSPFTKLDLVAFLLEISGHLI